ncbi:MAG: hypothetical protein HDS06_05825 [Bacteroides sp.]|nr:hypothetical protein [Bacteroides sp.]
MKTYILDTVNRLKRYSRSLDVKTDFCNKTWWAFNDAGEKTIYILQEDGSLYVTGNGRGIRGSWDYIHANKTIIFSYNDVVLMFHPEFMDENLLCLNLDGTNEYAFFIEEKNRDSFTPKTFRQLVLYFEEKERHELKIAEEKRQKEELEQQRRKACDIESEKRRQYERDQEAKEEYVNYLRAKDNEKRKEAEALKGRICISGCITFILAVVLSCSIGFISMLILYNYILPYMRSTGLIWVIIVAIMTVGIPSASVFFAIFYIVGMIDDIRLRKYKAQHPQDPLIKYL